MTQIDWSLLRPVDVGGAFQAGYEGAQRNALAQRENQYRMEERGRATELRNALSGAVGPSGEIDYGAVRAAHIRAGDIDGAMQIDQRRTTLANAERERTQANIRLGARIVRSVNPTDDATWQQARSLAQRAGVDLTGVPEQFDPQYVQSLIAAGQQLEPREEYTLGEGDVRYRGNEVIGRGAAPRQRYFPLPAGGRLVADPSTAPPVAPPAPGTVEDGYRFRGGDPANPQSWEPVSATATPDLDNWNRGGAGQAAPRTFP